MTKHERSLPREFDAYSRDDTLALKGIALLMMVWHHLFTMTEYIYEPWQPVYFVSLMDSFGCQGILQLISYCGKICVPMFFFLAGFGQYRGMEERGTGFDTLGRLKRFYLSYWKIFLLFIPAAFLFFANQNPFSAAYPVYANYNSFQLFPFVRSFLGIEAVYNTEWWFILPYVICTCLLPLWAMLIKDRSLTTGLMLMIVLAVVYNLGEPFANSSIWNMIFGQSKYCLSFVMGALMAKDHALEGLTRRWQRSGMDRLPVNALSVVLLLTLRLACCNDDPEMDILFTPVLIMLFTLILRRVRPVFSLFRLFGRHSTNIWLFHTFLCYYFCVCQHIVYLPKYAVLILPWFMAMCLVVSFGVDFFWSLVGRVCHAGVKQHG